MYEPWDAYERGKNHAEIGIAFFVPDEATHRYAREYARGYREAVPMCQEWAELQARCLKERGLGGADGEP